MVAPTKRATLRKSRHNDITNRVAVAKLYWVVVEPIETNRLERKSYTGRQKTRPAIHNQKLLNKAVWAEKSEVTALCPKRERKNLCM